MKIAIMGCGAGGSYLYALLRRKKPDTEPALFDIHQNTACGIKPCGWGVNRQQFSKLCLEIGLDPEKYLLGKYNQVLVNDVKIRANIAIIDKPSLIKDLLAGQSWLSPSEAQLDKFDRIIDATGARRAYLTPPANQPAASFQTRVTLKGPAGIPGVTVHRKTGYTWVFPIGSQEVHVGAITGSPEFSWQQIEALKKELNVVEVKCTCSAKIWEHGPILPFTESKIWGLGEAIGLIDPLGGAGIIPALVSARLMVENWDDASKYEESVLSRYFYMIEEARMIKKVLAGEKLSYREMYLSGRVFKMIGLSPTPLQKIRFMRKARRKPK